MAADRRAATEGMVLLKNNAALPLAKEGNIALFGVSSYDGIAGGTGSGNVNKPYVISISEGLKNAGYSLDERIADAYAGYLSDKRNRKQGFVMLGAPIWNEMPVSRNVCYWIIAPNLTKNPKFEQNAAKSEHHEW